MRGNRVLHIQSQNQSIEQHSWPEQPSTGTRVGPCTVHKGFLSVQDPPMNGISQLLFPTLYDGRSQCYTCHLMSRLDSSSTRLKNL